MISTPSQRLAHAAANVSHIDGTLMEARDRRVDMVRRMAADLVEFGAYHNHHDALLCLRVARYSHLDIIAFMDDARQAAVQTVVAREMSTP